MPEPKPHSEQIFKECQCLRPGYCDLFGQKMTHIPPNWKWCQDATPEERAWFAEQCEKKRARKEQERKLLMLGEYITTSTLMKDCRDLLLPKVAKLKLRGILGMPRSGMLPASILATYLNLPLYALDPIGGTFVLTGTSSFGGGRMTHFISNEAHKLLVVDDTIYSGAAMRDTKRKLREYAYFSCIYFRPEAEFKPDFYARELKSPHLLEWNLFNCNYMQHTLLDFDGILSPNVPQEVCQDETKYIEYIENVEPFYHRIPTVKCRGIVRPDQRSIETLLKRGLIDTMSVTIF